MLFNMRNVQDSFQMNKGEFNILEFIFLSSFGMKAHSSVSQFTKDLLTLSHLTHITV